MTVSIQVTSSQAPEIDTGSLSRRHNQSLGMWMVMEFRIPWSQMSRSAALFMVPLAYCRANNGNDSTQSGPNRSLKHGDIHMAGLSGNNLIDFALLLASIKLFIETSKWRKEIPKAVNDHRNGVVNTIKRFAPGSLKGVGNLEPEPSEVPLAAALSVDGVSSDSLAATPV